MLAIWLTTTTAWLQTMRGVYHSCPGQFVLNKTQKEKKQETNTRANFDGNAGRESEEIAANINLSLVQVSNNQWLNDEIINFYGNLLQECAQKMPNVSITIKNSFCFTKFKKEEFSNSFARWMDKDSSVLSDLLMFPINEDKHWTLCVVDKRNKVVTYYDSLGGTDCIPDYVVDHLKLIRKLVTHLYPEHNSESWSFGTAKDIPKQDNYIDCGVFLCQYMKHLVFQQPFSFNQKDIAKIRLDMVNEIRNKEIKACALERPSVTSPEQTAIVLPDDVVKSSPLSETGDILSIKEEVDQDASNDIFYVGRKFYTVNDFNEAKAKYEDIHFCELWKRDVRTLVSAQKRVPKRVANAELSLQYYSLKLSCKFGGRKAENRDDRKRDTKTFKQGCQFEVYIVLSTDGKALEVMKMTMDHNHSLSEELYKHLPRQRKLTGALKEEIQGAVRLKANNKLLQQKIQTTTGQRVTLKDISNLKTKTKSKINSNDLDVVVDYLKTKEGAVVEVATDEDSNFKSLFFQDQYMKHAYDRFPELLLVDATYKLLDLRMPLYVLMVVDGNGLSDIVALLIVAEESETVITAAMEHLKGTIQLG
ncbi:uncharacterized protein LOC114536483 isoform X1 [Dendronephthya gigantea]|uniref:uncharacterized protein LOC114536483 isoform X1 n=1 Tax=Dendronephthya gigantea TaxID=151771 RepID=UPI0010695054|nr:uncharacterized protein LOC114536483 isoform X1 [Dendronephthya gigantea]